MVLGLLIQLIQHVLHNCKDVILLVECKIMALLSIPSFMRELRTGRG